MDPRYHTQADKQLDTNWRVRKVGTGGMEGRDWVQWLSDRPKGVTVGVDSRLISHGEYHLVKKVTARWEHGTALAWSRLAKLHHFAPLCTLTHP